VPERGQVREGHARACVRAVRQGLCNGVERSVHSVPRISVYGLSNRQCCGAVVSVFTFCVAYYLVLLRPLFSGGNPPGGKGKIKREAAALSNSGTGLWNRCMTQPSLKVVFKPFRILYKRVLEYVLFFVAGFLKNSGSEIVKVVIRW
jgi:hypothetical protein